MQALQLKILLDKVGVIRYKQNVLDAKKPYNVFEVLRLQTDEVKLHSRFLGDLLNPEGAHKLGIKFFEAFLKILEISDFDTSNITVTVEKHRIDLLIVNDKKQAIIIENKINAGDRMGQMQDYKERVESMGYDDVKVFYLTLDGKEPESAHGSLSEDEYSLISYKNEIAQWVKKCLQLSVTKPELRETLAQYLDTIKELTDKSMDEELKDEFFNLMIEGDNILNARLIADNWGDVHYRTEKLFWADIEKIINSKYDVLDIQKWSNPDAMDLLYNTSRSKPWYGLLFEIDDFNGMEICLMIETSPYPEKDFHGLYYGLTLMKDGERIKDQKEVKTIVDALEDLMDFEANHAWVGGQHFSKSIDFRLFNNEDTLSLAKPEFRKSFIAENWLRIEQFIQDCKAKIATLKDAKT